MPNLVDMHMHAGFAPDPSQLARDLDYLGITAFSNTVTPGQYMGLATSLANLPNLHLGLGLHPWQVTSNQAQLHAMLESFDEHAPATRFIGELGLDLSHTHSVTKDYQMHAFAHVARTCSRLGARLVSIHCVRADRELMDILEESRILESCTCILHSYAGSSDGLKRALDDGCLFSIGKRMLATKKGREYARIMPESRLLIESDLPEQDDANASAAQIESSLADTLVELATIRNADVDELSRDILARSEKLLS